MQTLSFSSKLTPVGISNHLPIELWDEITHPFLNVGNGLTFSSTLYDWRNYFYILELKLTSVNGSMCPFVCVCVSGRHTSLFSATYITNLISSVRYASKNYPVYAADVDGRSDPNKCPEFACAGLYPTIQNLYISLIHSLSWFRLTWDTFPSCWGRSHSAV